MAIIESTVRIDAQEFKEQHLAYQELLENLQKEEKSLEIEPDSPAAEKLKKRKKFPVRERVRRLVDIGSEILEIAPFAGHSLYEGVPPGAGILTCIGKVSGKKCVIVANDPTVKGGTYFPMTVKKHIRAQEIALENHLPCIYLVDSGGAFLPLQSEVFPDRFHFGRIFHNQAVMSSKGIPQLSAVLGSCTAGGAYVPAMSDETIMVDGSATIFLGGPPLVKAATGAEITAEELGGAKVHCKISGVSDHLVYSEEEALEKLRVLVANLGGTACGTGQHLQPARESKPPQYNPKELYGIVGTDLKKSVSAYEIIARLVDESRFDEFKAEYGETLRCGFAHIEGFHVGIIANDGILFSESALKAAHFIELCNQRRIPLLFLQNIVGFMIGKEHEHQGIAKHGAKMVTAVASSTVPKLTVIIGGSFGAGNYGMCGRAYDPRFLFTWPNSRISVMGGNQAASVLAQVREESSTRTGEKINKKELEKYKEEIFAKYESEGSPWFATARLWDDGIIDPADTRRVIKQSLAACNKGANHAEPFGVFRM